MAIEWLALIKTSVGLMLKRPLNYLGGRFARRRAGEKAIRGEDLARQSSLEYMVRSELELLAASDKLPQELQSDECRNWLRRGDNINLFVDALIARASNTSEMLKRAEDQLSIDFERTVGETRKLASGRIVLAVSTVYGQIQATERGRQGLQLALEQWNAGQLYRLRNPERRPNLNEADLSAIRAMANALIEAGRNSWKMPQFVAPLTLEAHERQDDREGRPTNIQDLSSAIEAGDNLILFGPGGIGKTTFLLELCGSCMNGGRLIPLYVEAAVWARRNVGLFEYLAGLPSARANSVTVDQLTGLAALGGLTVMINGWNEISAPAKLVCREELLQLTAAAKNLSIVVVSRTSGDTPGLPRAKHIEVRGLTWHGQSAVVRSELGIDAATQLLDLLAKDTRLRHAARSPLILRGLTAKAAKAPVARLSVFDLLAAAVLDFEERDQRNLVLSGAPSFGHHRSYLEEVACLLTSQLGTNCSRDDALEAIYSVASRLAERHLIGALPQPAEVLDVLVSHHLLHLEDGAVRFAHQRFQEYFAASRLLRECVEDVDPPALMGAVVNQPAWNEALVLVAGKVKGEDGPVAGRARIVRSAAAVDLGVACDLVGACGLSEGDAPEPFRQLVTRVNELAASPLEEVRNLGVAFQIASGLVVFAEKLWPLIESEDSQTRLQSHRLNGTPIALAQLGADASHRVATWPSGRRVEFVHEIAGNADNYEFLVGLAQTEPDPAVRAAAICALFWEFPASDVPLEAWLNAPIEIQTDHNVLSHVQYALEDMSAGDAVRERLRTIAVGDVTDNLRLQLALAFPDEVGPRALDAVFERLRRSERHESDAPLVAIARMHAPERLLDLARERALQGRCAGTWIGKYLDEVGGDVKAELFERAWTALQGPNFQNLDGEVLGPLADRSQIERGVAAWLRHAEKGRDTLADIDHDRHRQLGRLLAHVRGDELLHVAMQRGQAASYNEAAQLVELLFRRIGPDEGRARTDEGWRPTVDEVRQLVALFYDKAETSEVPQGTISVHLCSIATQVAPAEFGSLLLDTCRRHLDAWNIFREKVDQWSKSGTSPRPHNPQWGLYLGSALAKWGPDALPGLLELMAHPSAMEFIPEAIARVVILPWASRGEHVFSTVSADIREGELRRSLGRDLRQPDDTFQTWTDDAAKALGEKLSDLVTACLRSKSSDPNWNPRSAEYQVGRLLGVVANIPSAHVVEPVCQALAGGLTDLYGTVGAMRGLIRQGLCISDREVIEQLEARYEIAASAQWHDESSRFVMGEFNELLLCAVPPSLLSKGEDYCLAEWRRFSHPNEVIRRLGGMRSEVAWPLLLKLGRELAEMGRPPEELAPALASSLTQRHFGEFLTLIADGTFFAWCGSEWTLERLAPGIAVVLGEEAGNIAKFLDACRQARSPLADLLASDVLSHVTGCEDARQSFLVEALDAGRAVGPNMPAFRRLIGLFTHKVQINDTQYEVAPTANNELRATLYARARSSGPIAEGCRRLLASVECGRREDGRPDDEWRHPSPEDGLEWTAALVGSRPAH